MAVTFSGRFLMSLIHFAEQQGTDTLTLRDLAGVQPDTRLVEDVRVSADGYNAVVAASVAHSGDISFGFHFGQYMSLSAAGLISQLVHSSATVRQALDLVCEFSNLGCQAIPMTIQAMDQGVWFSLAPNAAWEMSAKEIVRHTAEGMLLYQWRTFQSLTFHQCVPLQVTLKSEAMGRQKAFEKAFGMPVIFESEAYGILLAPEHVDAPIVTADYRLLEVLVQHAQNRLAQMQGDQGVGDRVKQLIMNMRCTDFPTIQMVAEAMHLSVRTLQRKLGAEGYSFRTLLEQVRLEMAKDHLGNESLSIADIAYLLRYAEVSAFSRSFKRQVGLSPAQFRQQS